MLGAAGWATAGTTSWIGTSTGMGMGLGMETGMGTPLSPAASCLAGLWWHRFPLEGVLKMQVEQAAGRVVVVRGGCV